MQLKPNKKATDKQISSFVSGANEIAKPDKEKLRVVNVKFTEAELQQIDEAVESYREKHGYRLPRVQYIRMLVMNNLE